jgi:hypothetical protein
VRICFCFSLHGLHLKQSKLENVVDTTVYRLVGKVVSGFQR